MARTIVYPRASARPDVEIAFRGVTGTPAPSIRVPTPQATVGRPPDEYNDKIAKYVPAEVLAFFAPMAVGLSERPNLLFAAAAVGLLATPGYLWRSARRLPRAEKPLPHFYVLAAFSFAVWASATTQLGSLLGLDRVTTSFLLGTTVFVLPLVDDLLARRQS